MLKLCHTTVRSIVYLRWANDCAISHYCAIFHENCAISHSLFLVQKLISRKFHFQKKWFIISLCSLLFVLCLSKSRDLTNTKNGSREITRNNGTKCALHYQSLSLSFTSFEVTSFGVTCLKVTCWTAPPQAMHSSARSALECIVLTFKTNIECIQNYQCR